MLTLLNMTRAELLPMVLGAQTEDVKLNIHIYEMGDALLVVGRNNKKNLELGFAITMKAIVDGLYRAQVPSSLRNLVYLLENFDGDPDPFHLERNPQTWRIH